MPRPIIAAIAAATALVAGCGGDDGRNAQRFDGDQREVAAVVDALEEAGRDGEPDRICEDVFAKELAKTVAAQGGGDCEDRVEDRLISDDMRIEVERVDLLGEDRARARVRDREGRVNVLAMVRQDGDWRISNIAR